MTAFHVVAKPNGPRCNLKCKYCYYLEKEKLFPANESFRMSDEVLENYIRQFISDQNVPEVCFVWQGGEPTLLGVEYFRKIVALQRAYTGGRLVRNALQTNGTLLNDEWCEFFATHNFLVGISIDGPPKLHDAYRRIRQDGGSYERVIAGLRLLKKHGVEFNTLTTVNRKNSRHPLQVYRFLRDIGSGYLQFIPIVERLPNDEARKLGLGLAAPPGEGEGGMSRPAVTAWSVEPSALGDFYCAIFDEWLRGDIGKTFVQLFDATLANWMGQRAGICLFNATCGGCLAMEHNGDVYSCDHYVYPQFRLGNILRTSLGEMAESEFQRRFGAAKAAALPRFCRQCAVRHLCHGECPKHRFLETPDGETGLNYLCRAYRKFFRHSAPAMRGMAHLVRHGRPAADIMSLR